MPKSSGASSVGAELAAQLKHGLNESNKSHSLPAREIRGMRGCWKPRCQNGVRKAGLAILEMPGACADRLGSRGTSLGRSRLCSSPGPWKRHRCALAPRIPCHIPLAPFWCLGVQSEN